MCTGAVSRYKLPTEPEICHVIKSLGMHWCGVRVERYEGHGIESREFKNRDKQMTFIVRVMFRPDFKTFSQVKYVITKKISLNCSSFVYRNVTHPNSAIPLVKLVFCNMRQSWIFKSGIIFARAYSINKWISYREFF